MDASRSTFIPLPHGLLPTREQFIALWDLAHAQGRLRDGVCEVRPLGAPIGAPTVPVSREVLWSVLIKRHRLWLETERFDVERGVEAILEDLGARWTRSTNVQTLEERGRVDHHGMEL